MCGNPFSGPSAAERQRADRDAQTRAAAEQARTLQRNLEANDQMDPAVIAARQRIARRMNEGIRSTYATSSRGLDGAAGSGLGAPPGSMGDGPIITTMDGRPVPTGMLTVDQRNAASADAAAEAERRRRRGGSDPAPTYRPTPGSGRAQDRR